eukprot:CAMPEP_0167758992 /NCGR_PEP_ID=MMETSP0110_2-20121227/10779_1 /TAXON_ID=629695 /ORGANISM="Gymnochlora sp., Strain CCMP2014" /LENGTH=175 /DNA_ID=CAMNT_0007645335 /DNA_START=201 /DNA_END=728 /DNA_ORIENTATION=+
MAGLEIGGPSEEEEKEPALSLRSVMGPDSEIGFEDGVKASIISEDGKESTVGFLSISMDPPGLNELLVDRLEVAPLEPFKRSLVCMSLLEELFEQRTIAGLHVDTRSWAEKEGTKSLSKLRPLASFAERKNMDIVVTMRSGYGAEENKIDANTLRGFEEDDIEDLMKVKIAQRFM